MELIAYKMKAGKYLKVAYEISEDKLEEIMDTSEDFTLFGAETLEEFEEHNTNEANLELLNRYPDSILILEGGRLDIIIRTPEVRLQQLQDFKIEGEKLTIFEMLIDILSKVEEGSALAEYLELAVSIVSIDDALKIIKFGEKGGLNYGI